MERPAAPLVRRSFDFPHGGIISTYDNACKHKLGRQIDCVVARGLEPQQIVFYDDADTLNANFVSPEVSADTVHVSIACHR